MSESTHIDVNLRQMYDQHGAQLDGLTITPAEAAGFDAALKISHCSQIVGDNLAIAQGRENAVDIDVCEDVELSGTFGGGPEAGMQVITIKGGCRNVSTSGLVLTIAPARGVHINVGDWMDQSYALTRGVKLNHDRVDGGPVWVRVGWAVPFTTKLAGGCKYLFWQSMGLKAYVIFKFGVRLILRIPKGQKGPSWL